MKKRNDETNKTNKPNYEHIKTIVDLLNAVDERNLDIFEIFPLIDKHITKKQKEKIINDFKF